MLGERWKNLSEKQKAPYEAKAAADKQRYAEEKAALAAVSYLSPNPITYELVLTTPSGQGRRGVRVEKSRPFTLNDFCGNLACFLIDIGLARSSPVAYGLCCSLFSLQLARVWVQTNTTDAALAALPREPSR